MFDFKEYEIGPEIVNYDGFVTPGGFLKIRTSDADDSYPTHSDYAREYMKHEWGMEFDNSYDALVYMTEHLSCIQYSNRVYIWENDNSTNTWQIYRDALYTGKYNDSTLKNLYFTCKVNAEFYNMIKQETEGNKTKK